MSGRRSERRLVPAYMATGGRAAPSRNTFDRLTLLSAAGGPLPGRLAPAQRRLAELVNGGPLSLAEAAAYLVLPVSVVRVLVADLVDLGVLHARAPVPRAEQHDPRLLERVLSGLRAIR
ncbi:DUF742 domain-containing protein [Streptomyces sp. OF3]|uniref:DUF742 domain-containing protein n=2 Tax=Streptomyces alkaliterrae TaxID=2213162 RepID=A0A5P0YTN9_9ACTN|nr:DUF742 domain-containing protein [Streptomyces alkaliterrae]MBB1252512.1 DUF742 domain-containing protein [Streptomyces alkaliterrae]MBB1261089.1 DUF742 domain-containing protein [Streptomyces alkaliterrae]MQS02997.1 DUF742 domain-containing protein [Streptomyces alkaliterrae]